MAVQFNPKYLKNVAQQSAIKKIKEESYSLMNLEKGMTVLDIGCGTGIDCLKLSHIIGEKGGVYGIDADKFMIEIANAEAKKAGLDKFVFYQVCESKKMPFEDSYFDSCRCERVLQHLSILDAKQTILESVRVTKPNGSIVYIDTDWTSLSIHSNNPFLERRIASFVYGDIKNSYAARGLPELFHLAGIESIKWETKILQLSFSNFTILIEPIIKKNIMMGYFSLADWISFLKNLENLEGQGLFYSTLNMVICNGKKQ